jgi:hypothetical protein
MASPVRPPAGGVIYHASARRGVRCLVLDLPTVMLVCKQGRRAGTRRNTMFRVVRQAAPASTTKALGALQPRAEAMESCSQLT